jgi:hypothetical protein
MCWILPKTDTKTVFKLFWYQFLVIFNTYPVNTSQSDDCVDKNVANNLEGTRKLHTFASE